MAWFVAPYARRPSTRPARYCILDDFSGIQWHEVEVLGGFALALVSGTQAALDAVSGPSIARLPDIPLADLLADHLTSVDIASLVDLLHELGYRNAEIAGRLRTLDLRTVRMGELLEFMRTRRLQPRFDEANDAIILDGPEQRCEPLPLQFSAAFPLAQILDDFNRANESPLSQAGVWTQTAGLSALQVLSNSCKGTTSLAFHGAYRADSVSNGELYATVKTVSTKVLGLIARLADNGGVSPIRDANRNGYQYALNDAGANKLNISRMDNGVNTQLGISVTIGALANNDKIGFEFNGSTLNGYTKIGAGAWTQQISRTDATYTTGNPGLVIEDTIYVLDDVGGSPTKITVPKIVSVAVSGAATR